MFIVLCRNTCYTLALALAISPAIAAPQVLSNVKEKPPMIKDASIPTISTPLSRLIGGLETTTTKYEDTLVHLARKYNVGFVEMRAANPGVDPWMPGSGTKITLPTQHIIPDAPHNGVVINLPEMRMYYFFDPKEPPATYPIGIGRTGLTTPLGSTTISHMSVDPTWRPTDRMRAEDPTLPAVVPPGPENPMGTHAMYLGWPSYAIHGTDKPYSIGRRLSSGCIRMYPEDIITLYDNVKPGTQIMVVDQPVKTAWINDKYYVQVHPTQEQSDMLSHDGMTKPEYPIRDDDIKTILTGVGPTEGVTLQWDKIRSAVKERRGIPIIVATKNSKKPETSITPAPSPDKQEAVPKKEPVKKEATKKEPVKKEADKTNKKDTSKKSSDSTSKNPTSTKGDIPPDHGIKKKE